MNIFDEVVKVNKNNTEKLAMTIRLNDGSDRSYKFGQMFEWVLAFASVLTNRGIKQGDRVAIISESCPEWTMSYLTIAKLHATSVLLDASLEKEDIVEQLEKSDVRCVFASSKVLEKLGEDLNVPAFNLLIQPEFYSKQCSEHHSVLPEQTIAGDENAASIIFSSGTTKKASGILHSHMSLIESTLMTIKANDLKENDRFLAILPNSHIYGVVCQMTGPLLLGSSTCFIEGLNSEALVGAFKNFSPSIFPAVPKIYELLKTQILMKINSDPKTKKLFKLAFPVCLKVRRATGINLGKLAFKAVYENFGGKLRILCSAGAPMAPDTAEFFYGLGFEVLITYGATETCIPTIGNTIGHISTDTCGKPYPAVTVKISEGGEILIKTPYRMLGYFNDTEATSAAFDEEGWFRSGDLGRIDKKGLVRVLGRCKENIVLATGKKIAPDDIEDAYIGIAGIKELVVCGIPVSDGSYDEVHAFVIAEANMEEAAIVNLKARCSATAQSKKLIGIHLVREIPKTSLQKPKRFLLKQMISENKVLIEPISATPTDSLDIASTIVNIIAKIAGTTDFTTDTKLFEELPIDSLGALDLACEINEQCGSQVEHMLHKGMTVSELTLCALSPTVGGKPAENNPYPKRKYKLAYQVFCAFRNLIRGFYRVKVKNDTVLPENSGYIICANHVSNFDYLYITLNFKKDRFSKFCCMAKKELFRNTWVSKLTANVCGMIPVDRDGFVCETMTTLQSKLHEQWGVLIHPEGTRSKNGTIGSFKNGAAILAIEADVPIVPAYIKGGYEVFPCWKKLPQLFNWKSMKKYQVDVIYGEPIFPKGLSPEELMEATKAAVLLLANSVVMATAT